MKLAIVGAGSIRDSLLFENYLSQAIDFFKEPIDYIIVDGSMSKGVRFLAEDFAEDHGITLIITGTKQIATMSDGLFILWHGNGKREQDVFYETQRMLKAIYEVRLEHGGLTIGEHNGKREIF